jgi:inorganic pyrophosphatase
MDITRIPTGADPPREINVVIEVPQGGTAVKYELDEESGALFADRFLEAAMFYPANYGFIPHTLAADGDPLDCMVVAPAAVAPGAVVRARPVGALLMEDEAGSDEKILAVPLGRGGPAGAAAASYRALPPMLLEQISHFFAHYKDLEPGKWVKVKGWADAEAALEIIRAAIDRARGAR